MHEFQYRAGRLCCEKVPVDKIVREHGSPVYVYSQRTLTEHFQRLDAALGLADRLICYAVKANSNLAVLRTLADLGSGFDIVSEGELRRVVAAGGDPGRCVFAGVGKTAREIEFALRQGIYCFNVESEPELERINKVAGRLRKTAPVAVRVNPNVDAHTHAKITTGTYENKFGIAFEQVEAVYARAAKLKHIRLRGLQMHIGSQLTELEPFEQAVRRVAPLAQRLAERYPLEFLSIGGGIGIVYQPALRSGAPEWWRKGPSRNLLTPATYAAALVPLLKPLGLRLLLEPGRYIVGNAGILVTRVEYIKRTGRKNFVIVDAAMNDLIRPAFYDAYHEIVPVRQTTSKKVSSDVVGPICESGDYFCKDRLLPVLAEGDLIALLSAGAYGSVMGSNYNSRAFPAEVMVDGAKFSLVRRRQQLEEIWRLEQLPSWCGDR
ncbi:MAG: diaminopimelate decarboxylase [Verrucomicrobia bacterium]|nr:diaminopimelate decarboxylase [Verrucomicrobiota bacterium]